MSPGDAAAPTRNAAQTARRRGSGEGRTQLELDRDDGERGDRRDPAQRRDLLSRIHQDRLGQAQAADEDDVDHAGRPVEAAGAAVRQQRPQVDEVPASTTAAAVATARPVPAGASRTGSRPHTARRPRRGPQRDSDGRTAAGRRVTGAPAGSAPSPRSATRRSMPGAAERRSRASRSGSTRLRRALPACGDRCEHVTDQRGTPVEQRDVAQRRAADPAAFDRPRHRDQLCRRLVLRLRVQPAQPQLPGLGQLDRGDPRTLLPATATSVTPSDRHSCRNAATASRFSTCSGGSPYRSVSSLDDASSPAGAPRRSGGRRPAAAARPGCSRAGCCASIGSSTRTSAGSSSTPLRRRPTRPPS